MNWEVCIQLDSENVVHQRKSVELKRQWTSTEESFKVVSNVINLCTTDDISSEGDSEIVSFKMPSNMFSLDFAKGLGQIQLDAHLFFASMSLI